MLIEIDSKGNFHYSVQISFGLLIDQYPFSIGISNGYEWFRNFDKSGKKIWNSKNYYDLQSNTLESITRE